MWPLSFVLLFATAVQPQQNVPAPQDGAYIGKIPQIVSRHHQDARKRMGKPYDFQKNLCFAIRSYHFRRQDGLAPVPAGVTTCTPASQFSQKQVARPPRALYVPMAMQPKEEEALEK